MEQIKVLLCCGAGFSSGFLAQKARKAAKKNKINISIEAKSESVVSEYVNQIDILLIGPHYESALERMKELCAPHGAKAALIPEKIYASLDGEALLDLIIKISNEGV